MAQFRHVIEAAKASGAAEWLPRLVEKDLTDPPTLLQHPSVVLETGMPPEVWRVFRTVSNSRMAQRHKTPSQLRTAGLSHTEEPHPLHHLETWLRF